jgi:hypothetical protein
MVSDYEIPKLDKSKGKWEFEGYRLQQDAMYFARTGEIILQALDSGEL